MRQCTEQHSQELGYQEEFLARSSVYSARRRSAVARRAARALLPVFGFLLLSSACAQTALAQEYVGLLLEMSGNWTVRVNGEERKLEPGQGLRTGSLVRPASQDARVVIHLGNDRVVTCTDKDYAACSHPFVAQRKSTPRGRFWRTIEYLVGGAVTDVVETMSRGRNSDRLTEAVLRLDGERVYLGAVFKDMKPGTYVLRFERRESNGKKRDLPEFRYQWESKKNPAAVLVPGLTPGFFRVLELDENRLPKGNDSWVLVDDPVRHQEDARKFRQAVAWTRSWSSDLGSQAARTFLRAYLLSLHESAMKRKGL
jgi:hypothetical protein